MNNQNNTRSNNLAKNTTKPDESSTTKNIQRTALYITVPSEPDTSLSPPRETNRFKQGLLMKPVLKMMRPLAKLGYGNDVTILQPRKNNMAYCHPAPTPTTRAFVNTANPALDEEDSTEEAYIPRFGNLQISNMDRIDGARFLRKSQYNTRPNIRTNMISNINTNTRTGVSTSTKQPYSTNVAAPNNTSIETPRSIPQTTQKSKGNKQSGSIFPNKERNKQQPSFRSNKDKNKTNNSKNNNNNNNAKSCVIYEKKKKVDMKEKKNIWKVSLNNIQ